MDRHLSARLAVCSLLALSLGCATERFRYEDDLVHTERPGYADAHAHNLRTPDEMAAPARWPAVKLPADARIVDLTHSFGEDTIYWPTEKTGFVLQEISLPVHGEEEVTTSAETILEGMGEDEYPHLTELTREHVLDNVGDLADLLRRLL